MQPRGDSEEGSNLRLMDSNSRLESNEDEAENRAARTAPHAAICVHHARPYAGYSALVFAAVHSLLAPFVNQLG
jgi:hypothetical protein